MCLNQRGAACYLSFSPKGEREQPNRTMERDARESGAPLIVNVSWRVDHLDDARSDSYGTQGRNRKVSGV